MGRTGAVSVMLEGLSTGVSAHALEPLPSKEKAFHSVPWRDRQVVKAGETGNEVWMAGGGGGVGGGALG